MYLFPAPEHDKAIGVSPASDVSVEAPNYGAHQRRQHLFLPYSGSKIQSEAGETLIASAAQPRRFQERIAPKMIESQVLSVSGMGTN